MAVTSQVKSLTLRYKPIHTDESVYKQQETQLHKKTFFYRIQTHRAYSDEKITLRGRVFRGIIFRKGFFSVSRGNFPPATQHISHASYH